jgi:hypothetical protein
MSQVQTGRRRSRHSGGKITATQWNLILLFAAFCFVLIPPQPALADAPLHRAGLVVRHGDGRLTYAYVTFREESISSIDLLQRSGIPLVTVSFGGLGEGVCSLEGDGCGVGECRRRVCQGPRTDDPYWQFFRQEAPGEWRWRNLGPSATRVHDGDIDGWSWTGEEPGLPAVTLSELATIMGIDESAIAARGEPFALVSTHAPPGSSTARVARFDRDWPTYATGMGILLAIGVGAIVVVRRRIEAPA